MQACAITFSRRRNKSKKTKTDTKAVEDPQKSKKRQGMRKTTETNCCI
jgi:hypothetical protein